ncbi:hypothetical protein MKW98_012556 [Papaver atlanticum]|uniref:Flowering-promoting factor 1-like protein 1 n=1 Tax=Papaver atlanticum TaxID=357466 RepID=A0AAD4T007_9MAGN|nr:hypothetical protein MKW98_012556 [Papaver atlanticum]
MSGVWVFKQNGVIRLVENPATSKVLFHVPTNQKIRSYSQLERILTALGWERYYDDADLLQFHKRNSIDLISLPNDFSKFKSTHMYDIVVKVPDTFHVRDT